MYFNVNITGSSYTQQTGIIEVSVYNGSAPYLINYRNFNGSPFTGTKVDNGLYPGMPEYAKAINVPIGVYYVDVYDNYGSGELKTECVIVGFSGYSQINVINYEDTDIVTFPCETSSSGCLEECFKPDFYWIQTEDGCNINLAFNECINNCFLIGGSCPYEDGCLIIDEVFIPMADECGWSFLNEDGNPPY